jgi:hypothetical protein
MHNLVAIMPHFPAVSPHYDNTSDIHFIEQFYPIVIGHADATAGHGLAQGPWLVGSVDAAGGVAKTDRPRPKGFSGPPIHRCRQHPPFHLAADPLPPMGRLSDG